MHPEIYIYCRYLRSIALIAYVDTFIMSFDVIVFLKWFIYTFILSCFLTLRLSSN